VSEAPVEPSIETPPPTYDFSGLPAGKELRETGPQSFVQRLMVLLLLCVGGLAIAFAGSLIAAIGTREIAKNAATVDPLVSPAPVPGMPNLVLVELGHTLAILGGLICASGIGLAAWNALRRSSSSVSGERG
jgi:hypothetical protein